MAKHLVSHIYRWFKSDFGSHNTNGRTKILIWKANNIILKSRLTKQHPELETGATPIRPRFRLFLVTMIFCTPFVWGVRDSMSKLSTSSLVLVAGDFQWETPPLSYQPVYEIFLLQFPIYDISFEVYLSVW